MRSALGKAAVVLVAAILLANPPRKPLKTCGGCQTQNEPDRTSCISCGKRF